MKRFDENSIEELGEALDVEATEVEETKEGFFTKGKKFFKKNWKKIAIGGGAVLAIGGAAYALTRGNDDLDLNLLTDGDDLDVAEGYTVDNSRETLSVLILDEDEDSDVETEEV